MIAIGLDPSLTGFGWAVIKGHTLTRCGVWQTERNVRPGGTITDDNGTRFDFLANSLVELIEAESIERDLADVVLFVEGLPVFGDRYTTAIIQGRCLGVVNGVRAALRLKLYEVPPPDVKRVVPTLERRKVSKQEVQDAVCELYANARELLPTGKIGLNASDAIAVAHAGAARLKFKSQLKANNGSGW